ncbi:MAG: ATP-dependent Clp protease adaptor ClpS [Chloroflexi bacterium]|nr:ATP-dependent Clp protease adaptor ClpS [Chloroflexota bacterium]MBI3341146.1 ATP-dependent Clp protease adaptor ClpS [Chloroflexota bacterium]
MTPDSKIVPGIHEDQQKKTAEEPLYRVIIHNDDVTPMDFVIHVLLTIFFVPDPNASHIMYTAHLNGLAYVQTLPRPEARRRIGQAHFAARLKSYPLQFTMEPE